MLHKYYFFFFTIDGVIWNPIYREMYEKETYILCTH